MADITISNLNNITPSTGLFIPATNGSTTGKVTLSQVCGVMTSAQITTALGYTPYNSTNPAGYITSSSLPSSQQLAKAWVYFHGGRNVSNTGASTTGANVYIISSYNVSSVLRNADNTFTLTFPSGVFNNANYIAVGTSNNPDNTSQISWSSGILSEVTLSSQSLRTTTQLKIYMSDNNSDTIYFNNRGHIVFYGGG